MKLWTHAAPEDTFLHRWMAYCEDTETPHAYDFMCGLWLLSAAVGRTVRVARPRAPVWLNMYVVLCAEAGVTRKSSAVRRTEDVYRAAQLDKDYVTVTGSITPEALAALLGAASASFGRAQASFVVSELVTVLGRERYSAGLSGLLTDLYDCPSVRQINRAKASAVTIRNAYVNMLAASTPSWLIRSVNPDIVEGGFTSRCLFVVEEQRKRRIAWPSVSGTDDEQRAALVADLRAVRDGAERWTERGITLSDNAVQRFVHWYEHREHDATDAYTASFEAREDHHVLRVAGLLAINDGSWTVSAGHLSNAVRMVRHHKEAGARLFGSNREVQRFVAGIDAVRNALSAAGELGLSETELLYRTRGALKVAERDYVLALMNELQMVQRYEVATSGRKRTVWRGTDKLMVGDINTLLLERLTQQ